jgi:VanZ family protein
LNNHVTRKRIPPRCRIWYRTLLNHGLSAAAILAAVLLFTGDSNSSQRLLNQLWNTGHIVAFALWTYLAALHWRWLSRHSFWFQFLFCVFVGTGLSFAIEIIQQIIGRTFSISDIRKNLIGCSVAFFFAVPARQQLQPAKRRILQGAAVLLILFEVTPLARSAWDDWAIRMHFPTLSNLESAFEIDRWSGGARLAVEKGIQSEGQASLRVELNTEAYSGASLRYFRRDWRGFRLLCFDLFNPEAAPLEVICRVDDAAHAQSGFDFDDRFNRKLLLHPGWNSIEITLEDIRNAPKTRRMDLAHIHNVTIFTAQLTEERTIYIDHVRLTR